MIKPYKNGTKEKIQGLDCYIPPIGYVYNRITKRLEQRGVLSRSGKKRDQYWERRGLPVGYEKKRKEEERIQQFNPAHIDVNLEEFRRDAWDKRLNGMWFYNKGEPTYITGLHYYYLEWVYIGGATKNNGYPDYWDSDRKFFYFLEYVIEDPECFGMVYVTQRRAGKTAKSVAFILEGVTRTKEANGGIQSKTDIDAEKIVYKAGVRRAFDKLPHFFQPKHNERAKSKNIIFRTTKLDSDDDYLGGIIDFRSSKDTAYDGSKLFRYVGDEIFKTVGCNIRERHEIVLPCLEDPNGRPYGKALYTSTVEEMEGNLETYRKFWDQSSPKHKDDVTGFTKTKLYHFFTPADESRERNIYGHVNRRKNREFIIAEREQVKGDTKEYFGRMRRKPLTIDEAFRASADSSVYDTMKLQDRFENISWRDDMFVKGNFVWKNGERDTEVVFEKSSNGKWKVLWGLIPEDSVIRPHQTRIRPWNNSAYAMGCDPYSHSKTVDYRNSNGAFYVYRKHDVSDPLNSNTFVAQYIARPSSSDLFFEDVIKTCFYFGCEVLIEDNRNNIIDYFKYRDYESFAMRLPGRKMPGIPGSTKTHGDIIAFTEDFIYNHLDKVYFKELLNDWLNFDPFNTTKFDAAMAAGYTLIANNKYKILLHKKAKERMLDINVLFGKN